ncbi:ATJ20 [Symbiodinium sp. KB8]|nr:ATJ20 [Symbiodinium sp. KB8]
MLDLITLVSAVGLQKELTNTKRGEQIIREDNTDFVASAAESLSAAFDQFDRLLAQCVALVLPAEKPATILVDFCRFADVVLRWERATQGAERIPEEGPDLETQLDPGGLLLDRLERQDRQNTELEVKYSSLLAELREKSRQFLRDRTLFRERLRMLRAHALATEDAELLQLLQHDVQFYQEGAKREKTAEDFKEEYEKKLADQEMVWKEVMKEKDYEMECVRQEMDRLKETNAELRDRRVSDKSGALQKKLEKAESILVGWIVEEAEEELRRSQEEARKWKGEHGALQKQLMAAQAAKGEREAELQEKLESLQSQLASTEAAARRAESAEQRLQKELYQALQAKKKPRLVREFRTHISIPPDGRLERAEQEARRLTTEVAGLAAALADAKAEVSRLQEVMLESDSELLERRQEAEALAAQLREARHACELEAQKSREAARQLEAEKQRSRERLSEIRALEQKHEAAQQQAAADLEQAEARAQEAEARSESKRAQEAEAQRESSEVQALAALARRRDVVNQLQQTEESEEREEIERLRKELQCLKSRESELLRQLDETLAQNSITSEDKQCQTDVLQEKAPLKSPEPAGKQDPASKMGDLPRQGTGGPCLDPEALVGNDELVDYPRVLAMGGGWLQGVSLSWRGKLRQHSKQTQTSRSPSAGSPGSKTPKKQRTRSPDLERHMPFELTAEGLSRGRSPQPQPFPKTAKVLLPLTAKAKRSTVCRSPPRLHPNNPNVKAEAQRQAQAQTRPSRSPESREKASNRVPDVERPRKARASSPHNPAAGHPLGGPDPDSVGPPGLESQSSGEPNCLGSGPLGSLYRSSETEPAHVLASIDMSRAATRQSADARTNTSRAAKDTGTMRRSAPEAASRETTPSATHGVFRPRSAAQLPSVRRWSRGSLGSAETPFRPCSAAALQRPS